MLEFLKKEQNLAFTENGAVTLKTTYSDCLDLFSTIGGLRRESEEDIISRFTRAFSENKALALKLLFFARDIRGGLGERRVFRVILKSLAFSSPDTVRKNLPFVAEYGRYDDLFVLFGTPLERDMLEYIRIILLRDIASMEKKEEVSLLGKWLPSVNASNENTIKMAKRIAKYLDMTDREYRKTLSALRGYIKIIENNLRERDYSFDYEKQPSKALFKYRNAFIRNRYICSFNTIADTNIEAVFDLILNTAVKNKLPSSSLPERLIIISDMEFNCCVNNAGETNFINAKRKFEKEGYILPKVVFWNVASRTRTQPVKENEEGVILVSGCSPVLFGKVADGSLDSNTPYEFMLQVLSDERYERISA